MGTPLTPIVTSPNYWVIVTNPNKPKDLGALSAQTVEVRKVCWESTHVVLPEVLFLEMPMPDGKEIDELSVLCITRSASKFGYTEIVSQMTLNDDYRKALSGDVRPFNFGFDLHI